jgi:hypothetical protein
MHAYAEKDVTANPEQQSSPGLIVHCSCSRADRHQLMTLSQFCHEWQPTCTLRHARSLALNCDVEVAL